MEKTKRNLGKSSFFLLTTLAWMAGIFVLSSFPGAESHAPNTYGQIMIRKLGHMLEFGGLAFWTFFLFRSFFGPKVRDFEPFAWSLIIVAVYSLSDEFHQIFVEGRTGRFEDFFLDISSAWFVLEAVRSFLIDKISGKKLLRVLLSVLVLVSALWLLLREGSSRGEVDRYYQEEWLRENGGESTIQGEMSSSVPGSEAEEKDIRTGSDEMDSEVIPGKALIENVPFSSQAPFADWDERHEEACEETSVIMLEYFSEGKGLDKEETEKEIMKMIDFEIEKYGDYRDTDAERTARLASDFYGLDLKIIYDFNLEYIKRYLAKGRPIIVPAAGRMLGNPFFTPPGPLYHNLVLIGYGDGEIVTNDPGTRRGEGYSYDEDILFEAIHDFPGNKEDIANGRKAMLVLE